jgi:ABC-type multidrug transport system ATPase subunit
VFQVVLDQPTKGMDIFDTFFLVEYLRQWAGRGRIVIMTLQPPTYEILTMISKVLLLSTGNINFLNAMGASKC